MGIIAVFKIVDYQGHKHKYYRFGDGYPSGYDGVFANFPQGDRDFCLKTYIRRLNLEERDSDYMVDVEYDIDLRSRMVEVSSGCYEDIDFKGTFEEAIRHFAYEDYSEKDALEHYPKVSDLKPILSPGFLDGLWKIVKEINAEIPWLKYDLYSRRILYVGDNINFYMYQDFIDFPSFIMNDCLEVSQDAFANARRVGVKIYFNNTVTNNPVSLFYMLTVTRDGYVLPLTNQFIPYEEEIPEEIKQEELAMIVMMLSRRNPKNVRAMNFLCGIFSENELEEIRSQLKCESTQEAD